MDLLSHKLLFFLIIIEDKVGNQIKLTKLKKPEEHGIVIKNQEAINEYQAEERKLAVIVEEWCNHNRQRTNYVFYATLQAS